MKNVTHEILGIFGYNYFDINFKRKTRNRLYNEYKISYFVSTEMEIFFRNEIYFKTNKLANAQH